MDEKFIKYLKQGEFADVLVVQINRKDERIECVKKVLKKHVNMNELHMVKELHDNEYICEMFPDISTNTCIYMRKYHDDLFGYIRSEEFIDCRLDPDEALRIIYECVHAIHFVHIKNFVHRDIKPENIFIDNGGKVKLGDFGSAVQVNTPIDQYGKIKLGDSGSSIHISGGTPMYMAPEVLHKTARKVTEAMDWWSLGVVLFELVTGRLPWGEDDCSIVEMSKKINDDERYLGHMSEIAKVSELAHELIEGLLVKDPEDRLYYNLIKTFVEDGTIENKKGNKNLFTNAKRVRGYRNGEDGQKRRECAVHIDTLSPDDQKKLEAAKSEKALQIIELMRKMNDIDINSGVGKEMGLQMDQSVKEFRRLSQPQVVVPIRTKSNMHSNEIKDVDVSPGDLQEALIAKSHELLASVEGNKNEAELMRLCNEFTKIYSQLHNIRNRI